jgi:hypothetical protein
MDRHITRLSIWHCAWALDQGHLGKRESSVAKVISSEAIWRVLASSPYGELVRRLRYGLAFRVAVRRCPGITQ